MDKLYFRLVMAFVAFVKPAGVNMEQLRSIVSTKLLMDRRRTPASWKQRQQKEPKNGMIGTFIMYGIMGLLVGIMIFFIPSLIVSMTLIHSYLIFMLIMTMITDFSSVLLDNTDTQIISPKPVSSKTLFFSRASHIFIYIGQLLTAIMIFPSIFCAIEFGVLTTIALLLTTFLTTLFAIFLTYILYALVLQWSSEQKVKDIISYFQIFMTIFFAIGYQIVPRLINFDNLNFNFTLHWYSYLLPPVWMAMLLDAVNDYNFDGTHLLMIACAIFIPVLISWLMVKFLAPYFSSRINAMQGSSGNTKPNTTSVQTKSSLAENMAAVVCVGNTEKAGFLQTWRITARDKTFKMQFYPGLAYIPIFIFIIIFKNFKNLQQNWDNLPDTNFYLLFIYLGILTVSTAIALIPYNENYTAGWVYQSSPLAKPGEIISGSIKSLLLKYFLPLYIILSAGSFYIWGAKILDDVLLGFFNNCCIFFTVVHLNAYQLPFTLQPNIKAQSGKFVKMILQFIIIGLLILLHYLALKMWWLVPALIPVSAGTAWFLLKRIQQVPWIKIAV